MENPNHLELQELFPINEVWIFTALKLTASCGTQGQPLTKFRSVVL